MKNADTPAMPTITYDHGAAMQGFAVSVTDATGLTKREMMAMHIAAGFAADKDVRPSNIAKLATEVADALLAELEMHK